MHATPDPNVRRQLWARLVLAITLVAFAVWLSATFIPSLLWAGVIGIAIDPLYTRAEARWPGGRGLALPAIATSLIALVVLIPLALGLVEAAREARVLIAWFEAARAHGVPEPAWLARLPFSHDLAAWWQAHLATPEATAQEWARLRGVLLAEQSQLVGRSLLHRGIIFLFTLVTLFFLLRERDRLVAQLNIAARKLLGPSGERIGLQLVRSVRGTIDGLVLVGIGEGAVMAVVYIVAGVPHPLLLGFMTAIAAMIPFGAAVLFAIACALLIGQGAVGWAVAVFAIGMVVVGIADHFIRPAMIGGSTRLPFLWVLIGILGGVETLGLLGLFVGPAVMATLIMLWRDYVGEGAGVTAAPAPPASPAAPPPPDHG
ncbi:AI-2E family transporter [uncultured Sphingomonas sp.]|uniref:AI-2E family transporter n=1 Tax=uncultured Sphingomonas sp. TaxID=158754 RepID=UPI0025D6B7DE|nr:AI-2E family transporter [uncultured Sphingomonas sp.]